MCIEKEIEEIENNLTKIPVKEDNISDEEGEEESTPDDSTINNRCEGT